MEKEMEMEKNIIMIMKMMKNLYLKANLKMEKEMEKEKNIWIMVF